jgi:hypothetical protein
LLNSHVSDVKCVTLLQSLLDALVKQCALARTCSRSRQSLSSTAGRPKDEQGRY